MSTIYEQVHKFLDEDERIIYPKMYKDAPWLYDNVRGTIYLVRDDNGPVPRYDWVWPNGWARLMQQPGEYTLISKMLLVRVRDPKYNKGYVISIEEYQDRTDAYVILDTILVVTDNTDHPRRLIQLSTSEYQANASDYDIIDTCYLVINRFKE